MSFILGKKNTFLFGRGFSSNDSGGQTLSDILFSSFLLWGVLFFLYFIFLIRLRSSNNIITFPNKYLRQPPRIFFFFFFSQYLDRLCFWKVWGGNQLFLLIWTKMADFLREVEMCVYTHVRKPLHFINIKKETFKCVTSANYKEGYINQCSGYRQQKRFMGPVMQSGLSPLSSRCFTDRHCALADSLNCGATFSRKNKKQASVSLKSVMLRIRECVSSRAWRGSGTACVWDCWE